MKTAHNVSQQSTLAETDFSHFSPRAYLDEYHCDWDEEDEFLMAFLHDVYQYLDPQRTLLEIGGGPQFTSSSVPETRLKQLFLENT